MRELVDETKSKDLPLALWQLANRARDITADLDVIFVISNCPQVNNPCNGFNPTPIRVLVWDAPAA